MNLIIEELQNSTARLLIDDNDSTLGKIYQEFNLLKEDEIFKTAREQMLNPEVAITVLFELTYASPLF